MMLPAIITILPTLRRLFHQSFTISNLGDEDAANLYAKLSSTSGWLALPVDSVYIGTLSAGTQIILNNDFLISVSGDVPDNTTATLKLSLKDDKTEKQHLIDLCLHAPKLSITYHMCLMTQFTSDGDLIS
ncbi:MAG: hypothetical protein MZV63_36730 [Marinilabiliales bacterium]|nr:hypothetical protein [Marinilabiliales bacterium]